MINQSVEIQKRPTSYSGFRITFFCMTFLICLGAPGLKGQTDSVKNPGKAFISFRIGPGQSLPDRRFHELLDLFDKYKGVTDEITFFTSGTHAPLPLDVFKQRMLIFKDRMQEARKRGYRTGINILATIGHHNENLGNSIKGDYTHVTDINGKVSLGSYCPNDENYRKYIIAVYRAMAEADPDYIWIDDDIRLAGHMPVTFVCFCDHCLSIFEKEYGKKYTRETLKKAFDTGTTAEKITLRNKWLQHNRNTISRLFALIEETVHNVKPGLPLGFMTGDRFFEGYDFENWAKQLSGPSHAPVMWRPGGGFYEDNITSELAQKSHDIGRQVSALPPYVLSIQSEVENFPYQRLKKAANIVALEAASDIAAGCTGAAFNVLSFYDEPLDEYESLLAKLAQTRPFFDLMVRSLGRTPLSGIQTFWNKNSFSSNNVEEGDWLHSGNPVVKHELYDIGLPATYSGKQASVVILGKDNIYALSRTEIESLLSGGIYMDAGTLQQLNKMGYGDLTGFEVVDSADADRIEEFTNHKLNGAFSGRERDDRQSFNHVPVYTLRKTSGKAEVLSGLIDYSGKETGACSMGVFENRLGGRICVEGYYPWTFMSNLSKSAQMKSVFRWLSKETLPGYISSFHKINIWIREPQNGRIALAFTNASFDPAENVVLMLKTTAKSVKVFDMECKETSVHSSGTDGPYQQFVIPHVDPWQMRLVISE
jgi:hypothetical protein